MDLIGFGCWLGLKGRDRMLDRTGTDAGLGSDLMSLCQYSFFMELKSAAAANRIL